MNYIYALLYPNTTGSLFDRVFYIGQTKDIKTRITNHRTEKSDNPIKRHIIKKYGFEYCVLWETESEDLANEREAFLIRWYGKICNNTGILANIADGGNLNKPFYSREEKKKIIDSFVNSNVSMRQWCKNNKLPRQTLCRWLSIESPEYFKCLIDNKIEDIVTDFKKSGLSKNQFCKNNKMDTKTLSKYIKIYDTKIDSRLGGKYE